MYRERRRIQLEEFDFNYVEDMPREERASSQGIPRSDIGNEQDIELRSK